YEFGGLRSESTSFPLNFAFTGPTDATMTTRYSVSDTLSIDSQPAMHAFRTSGSFSPRQTSACGTGISCSPVISMGLSFLYAAHGPSRRTHGYSSAMLG